MKFSTFTVLALSSLSPLACFADHHLRGLANTPQSSKIKMETISLEDGGNKNKNSQTEFNKMTNEATELRALRYIKRGINALNGDGGDMNNPNAPIHDVFSFSDNQLGIDDLVRLRGCGGDVQHYKYPDKIMTWDFAGQCTSKAEAEREFSSSFESSLKSQARSFSGGYEQETDISLEVPIKGATVGAESTVRTAALFGRSSASEDYKSRAEVGETKSFSVETRGALYKLAFRKDQIDQSYLNNIFIDDVLNLESKKNNGDFREDALAFFNKYGTHYNERMEVGAHLERSTFFSSDTTNEQMQKVQSSMTNTGFSVLGFSFGSDSSTRTSHYTDTYGETQVWLSQSRSNGGDPSQDTPDEFCTSAFCDDLLLVPVGRVLEPIYNLFEIIDGVSGTTLKDKMENHLSDFLYPNETCKWDNNARCTWDPFLQQPDCQDNCVCLLNNGDSNNEDNENCRTPLMYGQPYYLQVVTGKSSLRRWLTNSRAKKTSGGSPKTGTGDRVWTQDGAHTDGQQGDFCKGCPNISDQYRWSIRSNPGTGQTINEQSGQIESRDDKRNECIKYGDTIFMQGLGRDNDWLTGRRGKKKENVRMENINSKGIKSEHQWIVRSTKGDGKRSYRDPRQGQCVRSKDHIMFQNKGGDYDFITGARDKGNYNVYTKNEASPFEIRSSVQENGQTTSKQAQPRTLPL